MSDRPEEQRVLQNIVNYEFDVFLIFATEDEGLARQIYKGLEDAGLRCNSQFRQDAFPPGRNVFDSIVHNVKTAHWTLLLLTENSLESQWVTLETILALEESQRSNSLRLRMLVTSVDEKRVKVFKRGVLAAVSHIRLDFNKNGWNTQLKDEICLLKSQIKSSEIYKEKHLQVSTKYYMLLPGTCNIFDDLSLVDDEAGIKIERQEVLKFECSHAGKTRTFNLTIYKISKGLEEFYFFADFPHVLKSMFLLEKKGLGVVDIPFQIARFYYTMNEMINHAESELGHNMVQLLLFNENIDSMASVLWNAVSNSVAAEVQEELSMDLESMQICQPVQRLFSVDSKAVSHELDATISCCDNCKEDRAIADDLDTFLSKKGKSVETNPKGQSNIQLPNAAWNIFILSKEALESSPTLTTQCMSVLAYKFADRGLNVLVIIRDLEPRHVPRMIKCVNMLKTEEPNYRENLLKSMNGSALRLEHSLPAGDVATGLAWAYVINYLIITLLGMSSKDKGCLDLRGRIQNFLKEKNMSCGCILKMFIVLPKSCTTELYLANKANERPDNLSMTHGNGHVKHLGKMLPVEMNTGGQLDRPFFLHMYQHEVSDRSTCFIAEYCPPTNCMREMAEQYKFAGMSYEEVEKQSQDFVHAVEDIIQRGAVKEMLGDISLLVDLIHFDDKQETLLSAIERHIQVQAAESEIVYAEDRKSTEGQDVEMS